MTEQRLPQNYIDPSLFSRDQELLRIFYAACSSECGSADEVTLRGIRAIADWQLEQVIEWIEANPIEDYVYTDYSGAIVKEQEFLKNLKQAMRPQQQQENNNG